MECFVIYWIEVLKRIFGVSGGGQGEQVFFKAVMNLLRWILVVSKLAKYFQAFSSSFKLIQVVSSSFK